MACIHELGYDCPDIDGTNDEEENEEIALDYLRDNTQVIEFKGGIIIAGF